MRFLGIIFGIFAFLMFSGIASASYVQGEVDVLSNGDVRFNLKSDKDLSIYGLEKLAENVYVGESGKFTSKSGEIWSLNLDFGEFDDIFVDVNFPSNLERIVSLEGNEAVINFEDESVNIIDSGDFNFKASYILGEDQSYVWFYLVLFVIILVLSYFIWKFSKKRNLKEVFPYIGDKEQEILEILMNGELRQKELRNKLGIPKASFTRYMINLEKKKLIERVGEGKNKIVRVK